MGDKRTGGNGRVANVRLHYCGTVPLKLPLFRWRRLGCRQLALVGRACQLLLFAMAAFEIMGSEGARQAFASTDGNGVVMAETAASFAVRPEMDKLKAAIATDRIPDVLVAARVCRNSAFRENKLREAERCNATLRDAAYYLGDAHAVLESAFWQSRHAVPNDGPAVLFQGADLARLVRTVAPLSVSRQGAGSKLEYVHPISLRRHVEGAGVATARGSQPAVVVRINGRRVTAMVDTGTYVPLMLDQAHAYELGAVPLVTGITAPRSLAVPSPQPDSAAYDLVSAFRFGGVVMHNVLAIVVRNGYLPGGAIVGLPVLARYNQVTFGKKGISLGETVKSCDGTRLPLIVTPSSQGFGLVFPVKVHGRSVKAMFDTGSNKLLLARPALFTTTSSSKRIPRRREQSTSALDRHSLSTRIGRLHLVAHGAPVGVKGMSADIDIGAPVLAAADVRINFSDPSLCFIPKLQERGR